MIKGESKEENVGHSPTASSFKCGSCIACFRVNDCERCENCLNKVSPCLRRICVQAGLVAAAESNGLQQSVDSKQEKGGSKKDGGGEPKKKFKKKEGKSNGIKKTKMVERISKVQALPVQQPIAEEGSNNIIEIVVPKRKPHKPHKPHVWRPKELRGIKKGDEIAHQCYGPNCAKAARLNSKYCCDECGLLLADHRLKYILKGRVTDFYRLQPMAEKIDDKKIRELTVKKAETESDLEMTNKYAELFELYISSLCKMEPRQPEPQTSNSQIQDFSLFCIVCGQEFSASAFLLHLKNCSSEQEKKFVYGSQFSLADNVYDLVCDQFSSQTQTYCKRLRVACSEHYKDTIGFGMKTCGYPLKWENGRSMRLQDMFSDLNDIISGGICIRSRMFCQEHINWEQNVRALIDNHRMRLLLYLDELDSEYFHIFEAYRTRGDALTLLSNSRQPSRDAALKEESDYQKEQMSGAGFLTQKQEELSVENLYHSIKATRSAKTTGQTLNPNGSLIEPSSSLLSNIPADIISLLPLIQNRLQSGLNSIYGESSSPAGLRPCFGSVAAENTLNTMEALVKIEQK